MNTTPARFALVVGDWFDGETRRGPATCMFTACS